MMGIGASPCIAVKKRVNGFESGICQFSFDYQRGQDFMIHHNTGIWRKKLWNKVFIVFSLMDILASPTYFFIGCFYLECLYPGSQ